jgi:hypothetical protein
MMDYPNSYYHSSYPKQPDFSHLMQNPLDNGSQAFYQPYGDEISISQEE